MKVRASEIGGFITVDSDEGELIYQSPRWVNGLSVNDVLRSICGNPFDGWFSYFENDEQWLQQALRLAGSLTRAQVGTLAIGDPVNLRATPDGLAATAFGRSEPNVSQTAASALAVRLFVSAWEATDCEAAELVRLNLFTSRVAV